MCHVFLSNKVYGKIERSITWSKTVVNLHAYKTLSRPYNMVRFLIDNSADFQYLQMQISISIA